MCNSGAQVTGHGNSSKNSVQLMFAGITERPELQGWTLKVTSSHGTRQLMVNNLYFICNLTLHYADTLNQAVSGQWCLISLLLLCV